MGRRGVFLFLLILAIVPLLSAEPAFYVPKDANYSVGFNCEIDDAICSDVATCGVSIYYINSTALMRNGTASNLGGGEFQRNLTVNQTSKVGEYRMTMVCLDGAVNGSQTTFYEVSPSGIRSTQQRTDTITRSVYFMLIIAILLFISFLFIKSSPPVRWTYFAFSVLFFLIAINLIFTSLQDETINPKLETFFLGFTAISWYFYWFIGFLLVLMWILAFIQTWIFKKNLANAKRYGLA